MGKGAFGAAYGEDATGDAQQNSVKDANKGRSKRKARKNKRKAAELKENSEQVYQAYGNFHPLSACWYMFPDNAPKRFTPRADIQKEVEEKINTDTDFKKKV